MDVTLLIPLNLTEILKKKRKKLNTRACSLTLLAVVCPDVDYVDHWCSLWCRDWWCRWGSSTVAAARRHSWAELSWAVSILLVDSYYWSPPGVTASTTTTHHTRPLNNNNIHLYHPPASSIPTLHPPLTILDIFSSTSTSQQYMRKHCRIRGWRPLRTIFV